jgi:hypothetical protein
MRLWSLHPQYLDRQGLLALWREALLAQKVLAAGGGGYSRHPQLARFRAAGAPLAAIAAYLRPVAEEARRRGYRFDESKVGATDPVPRLAVAEGQIAYEWGHLLRKLEGRAPALAAAHAGVEAPRPHPLFHVVPGPVASWERP